MSGMSGTDGWGNECRSYTRVCNTEGAQEVGNLTHIYVNIPWEEVVRERHWRARGILKDSSRSIDMGV